MTELLVKTLETRTEISKEERSKETRAVRRKIACRKYYERHKEELRAKARERAARYIRSEKSSPISFNDDFVAGHKNAAWRVR
ncbi:hypothetical protein CVT26_002993 [Gymnopilus dilepis]|uniref:Uncharacterized protein n=1 Tax=Gymnopilus dilepis TaxID=231916 RepID=A0A409Y4H0_9AGAR|nr:hypothetical protein CVT26_002993 [Gymnopilus dilepis]